ncbi:MAG: NAD(P)H:quinone oxidoreductase [Gemmatimonadaceae bacterium]
MSNAPYPSSTYDTLDPADVKVAVIYYSATGNVYQLARAAAEAAEQLGASVRLRRVHELAPPEAIQSNPQWAANVEATRDVPIASLDDLVWADAVLLGTPTRYGTIASQLKQFIDITGPAWQEGKLSDKVYAGFVSTATLHGGHESTLLSLSHVFHHWGGIIVPPGYTDPIQFQVGNPYGASHFGGNGAPNGTDLEAVRYLAKRATRTAAALKAGRRVVEHVA